MIYLVTKHDTGECAWLLMNMDQYNNVLFNPTIEPICTIELGRLKGKTYKERKECLRDKAIEFSLNQHPGLYTSDLVKITNYFAHYGRRYGLLRELQENAIC